MRNPFRYFKTSPDNIRLVRLGRVTSTCGPRSTDYGVSQTSSRLSDSAAERFPVTARQQHIVRLNPASAPSLPRRDWFVLLPTVPSQHQKLSCSHLITRRGPMPRSHRAQDCHGQYVGEMCGNPGFVPSARAKGIRNCRRRASGKRLKESTIFSRTLGAESIGLEKTPSQSPAVAL